MPWLNNTPLSLTLSCDDLPIPTLFPLSLLSSPVLNMMLNCVNYALCFMTTTDTWNKALVKIPSVAYQKTKEGSTTNNEERCQLDTPCSPSLKEQVPSAKPSDLSMTIPYVFPPLMIRTHTLCFLSKEQSFNITTKRKTLLIVQRWILIIRSALILWCRISSRCLHLGMERQLIVPPGLLGLLLLLGQEIPRWTSMSGIQYDFILGLIHLPYLHQSPFVLDQHVDGLCSHPSTINQGSSPWKAIRDPAHQPSQIVPQVTNGLYQTVSQSPQLCVTSGQVPPSPPLI